MSTTRATGRLALRPATHTPAVAQGRTTPLGVIETKLIPPQLRPGIVSRDDLLDRLADAKESSVVGLFAPAGYGKTTLLEPGSVPADCKRNRDRGVIVESSTHETTRGFERHSDRQRARSQAVTYTDPWAPTEQRLALARTSAAADERRRMSRDLHDSVQNELLCLILELELAENDRDTPLAFADKLAAFRGRAEASLDSIHEILHGELPSMLAAAGFEEAIRERATRAPMPVGLVGVAPRSNDAAEEAAYFACLEALQNVAKHARPEVHVTIRMHHSDGNLRVYIEDNGGGFVPEPGREGGGLTNIRDRIASVGGTVKIASAPGRGTAVALKLPWPQQT
jgi:signal transduction histidine kinase